MADCDFFGDGSGSAGSSNLYVGSKPMVNGFVGSKTVSKIYKGTKLVYEGEPSTPPPESNPFVALLCISNTDQSCANTLFEDNNSEENAIMLKDTSGNELNIPCYISSIEDNLTLSYLSSPSSSCLPDCISNSSLQMDSGSEYGDLNIKLYLSPGNYNFSYSAHGNNGASIIVEFNEYNIGRLVLDDPAIMECDDSTNISVSAEGWVNILLTYEGSIGGVPVCVNMMKIEKTS